MASDWAFDFFYACYSGADPGYVKRGAEIQKGGGAGG